MKSKKIIVTGGAGFIGSHLVDALSRENQVTVIDNLSTGRKENLNPAAEFIKTDISRQNAFSSISSADVIFHLAAQTSVMRSMEAPHDDFRSNALGTINVLELAKQLNSKVVYTSSCAIYGEPASLPVKETHAVNPISPYAVSKLAAEKLSSAYSYIYGLDATSLRLFNVYGPRQSGDYAGVISIFIENALDCSSLKIFGDGSQFRDFVYVSDVVKALLSAASPSLKGKVLNVGTGRTVTINDLAKKIISLAGSESKVEHVGARKGEIHGMSSDTALLKKEFGWVPGTNLEDGLKSTIKWFS
ncbi:MAG: NAD-dependent epimerase/dehydratase family protein [archaeon]